MTPEQERQLKAAHDFMLAMQNDTTIPFAVDGALRKRLENELGLSVSAKGADTEDQAVNEAGAGTYDVLGDPVGFLKVTIGGTVHNVPYY